MFERIVVAYDGSESSAGAAQLAFRLGARSAHVLLVHVIEESERLLDRVEELPELRRGLHIRREESLAALDALAGSAPSGAHVESRVIAGDPAGRLTAVVREQRAGLLAMGTHGVGGLRSLLGSVSHKLLVQAGCPVLLLRAKAPPADADLTVLAALDGSWHSLRALQAAESLAGALHANLRLVHVLDISGSLVNQLPARYAEELREEGRGVLRAASATLTAAPERAGAELREGDPRVGLLAACDEHAPAILVMATRGVGGFSGLIGSTTRHVVGQAACPVLVTRAASGRRPASRA